MKGRAISLALGLAALSFVTSANAQTSASAHTYAKRYDAMGRVTGIIAPDPDGGGVLGFLATRNIYDAAGRLSAVEEGELSAWQSEAILPTSWAGFSIKRRVQHSYDDRGRKTATRTIGDTGTVISLTQYSYDNYDRLECVAQRMNAAIWSSLPASACTLGAEGSYGPDRIERRFYDNRDRIIRVQQAVGTPAEEDYVTYTYIGHSNVSSTTDARGYKASMTYDGHDRQVKWNFPSKTTVGAVSTTDYEEYGYDANGNRTSLRKRDGSVLTYQYDALDRMTIKVVPDRSDLGTNPVRDVYYEYDLRGLMKAARYDSAASTDGVFFTYDGFGRQTGSTITLYGSTYALAREYNKNGIRTKLTHPDGTQFDYSYDGLDRATAITQGATTIAGLAYDNRDNRASLTEAVLTTYGYDAVGRLNALSHNLSGTTSDVAFTYGYTPASQIASQSRDNDTYAWSGHYNVDRSYTVNGLNQYTSAGAASFCYDANGNLTADGTTVYQYDVENRLVQARVQVNTDCAALLYTGTQKAGARYDPLGRLYMYGGTVTSPSLRFVYDGDALVAEYSHVEPRPLLRRYVHGPGVDEPLAWYEGSGVTSSALRRLRADHQGSVIAVADNAGAMLGINRYDEYGIPAAGNLGKFQYTGQLWLADLGMYYYKARMYSPTLGRFLQTDSIGYEDHINLYAYVRSDPLNKKDPTGTEETWVDDVKHWWNSNVSRIPSDIKSLPGHILDGTTGLPPTLSGGGNLVSNPIRGINAIGISFAARTAARIEAKAASLAALAGKNSVKIPTPGGFRIVDLAGMAHYSKDLGRYVATPHVQSFRENVVDGVVKSVTRSGDPVPATMKDLKIVEDLLKRLNQ